jgi:hypothetical protein
LDGRGVVVRVSIKSRIVFFHVVQAGSGFHPASYSMGTGYSLLLTTCLKLVCEVHPLPPYVSMVWCFISEAQGRRPRSISTHATPRKDVKYLGLQLDRRLTWHKHICAKGKQLGITLTKMYWLLGRKSKLSTTNKLLAYKTILQPIWT